MPLLSEIRICDPFIILHENTHYLYGTIDYESGDRNLYAYQSKDLIEWDNKCTIFTISEEIWAKGELWAPEVHRYNGKFYLFVSILGKNGLRGTQIAVCDTPNGTFLPIPDGNYVVLGAVSETGKLRGPWRHLDTPRYDKNGGHAMFFCDCTGQKKLCIHAPERYPDERACLFDVAEQDGILVLS